MFVGTPYSDLNLRLFHPSQTYDVALYYDCAQGGGWARNIGWAHNIGEATASYNVGVQTGWYYVAVKSYNGANDPTTPYRLEATVTSNTLGEPNDSCGQAAEIRSGQDRAGYITPSGDKTTTKFMWINPTRFSICG